MRNLFQSIQSQCASACKSVSLTNVSQTLNLALNVSCISSTQQNLDFYSNLEVQLTQQMCNDKDFLALMVTAFSALVPLGNGTVNQQIARFVAEVKTTLQNSSSADMSQLMLQTQNMVITGTGIAVHNVSMNALKTFMVQNVYSAISGIKVVTENNYTVVQELLDRIASLKDIFATAGRIGTTWIDSLSSAWRNVLFVAIGVTSIIFAIWLIVAIWAYVSANNALERARKEGCDVSFRRPLPPGATPIVAPTLADLHPTTPGPLKVAPPASAPASAPEAAPAPARPAPPSTPTTPPAVSVKQPTAEPLRIQPEPARA
jgi:hypothetical protein